MDSSERAPKDRHPSHQRYILIGSIAAVAVLFVAAVWAVTILHPMPPRSVVMTTGSEGGAYHEFGKRYREIFKGAGIELRLMPSAGGIENLRRLSDPNSGVSAGFVQGGTAGERESQGLLSLGTVSYEPIWFFYRGANPGRKLEGLRGKRISIGPEGSGTRVLALTIFERIGIVPGVAEFLPYAPQAAGEKLLGGQIEAAVMVASWESPVVQRLLASETVNLMSFQRADALVAMYPYLSKVVVPEGVGNMAGNRPATNVVLLAPVTSLVVRKEMHPAIQSLFLEAATETHSAPGIFHEAGRFPAPESVDLPLSDQARQFYRSGRPFLQRYLPFWFAVLLGQLLVLLIPVVGAIYPLVRFLPAIYGWGMRRRILRLYGELKFLDGELESRSAGEERGDLAAQLDRLETRASRLKVPTSYANMLFGLRRDIQLVRGRLENP